MLGQKTINLNGLIAVILLTTIGLIIECQTRPQTSVTPQSKQALSVQDWNRTIQAVNQLKRGTPVKSGSQLVLYRALKK